MLCHIIALAILDAADDSQIFDFADTPMWNADQDQIVDLVDFLAAHGRQLNEVGTLNPK